MIWRIVYHNLSLFWPHWSRQSCNNVWARWYKYLKTFQAKLQMHFKSGRRSFHVCHHQLLQLTGTGWMGGRPDLQFNTRSPNSRQPPKKTQVSPPAASSPALLRYRSAACHAMTVASPAQGMPKSAERLLPLQSAARCAAGIPAGHHRHRGNLAPSKSKHGGSMWVLRPSLVNIIYTYIYI